MATAHLYIRTQVTASNDAVAQIVNAAKALEASIEAAGGPDVNIVTVDFDDEPAHDVVVVPVEVSDGHD